MTRKRHLAFVSPRFLFPADSGGKIRTTQILRGMLGGEFHITLLMPDERSAQDSFESDLAAVADEVVLWPPRRTGPMLRRLRRIAALAGQYPVSVAADNDRAGVEAVDRALSGQADVVVFDFPHSAILAPPEIPVPSVMFTHNVESEILERHVRVAESAIMRAIWRSQWHKMRRFEQRVLGSFDTVVAVSDRDREYFEAEWNIRNCRSIPTGVDTEFHDYRAPNDSRQVVFCGSMDWMANIDAVEYFHARVWPLVRRQVPDARMKVVGRSPSPALVDRICSSSPEWEFSGFVDDVREHVGGAAAFVIPLRVGGGTRIKAFEAMALGSPVVSTAIGVEGLPVNDGEEVLIADDPESMAEAIATLLTDESVRMTVSRKARRLVEEKFGYRVAARVFETICMDTLERCQRMAAGVA